MMNRRAVATVITLTSSGRPGSIGLCLLTILCLVLAIPGSAGSSVSVPLGGGCPTAGSSAGAVLSAGLGEDRNTTEVVDHGEGAALSGYLIDQGGRGVPNALICIYSGVLTDNADELVGLAPTNESGRYEFQVPSGPSRNLTVVYRSSGDQLSAWALLQVRAGATLQIAQNPVHNKHFAYFSGKIPGPHSDGVIVVLQAKSGRGWRVFRRYSTRDGGKFSMKYRFTQTFSPTIYTIRAEVSGAPGYPYLSGVSPSKDLRVLP
jgi:hypothetical protein